MSCKPINIILRDGQLSNCRVGVVGLGYVGLPLSCLFSSRYPTTGYDCNAARVAALCAGHDATLEVEETVLQAALQRGMVVSDEVAVLRDCTVYIVTVPTPVDENNRPNLDPLIDASRTVGSVLSAGDVVIYESTVYPGVTEEVCIPEVEQVSGLCCNQDFYVGYSPERINPGDKEHTVESICKVTSGSNAATADVVDALYRSVLKGGTHRAPSIKVAEASKIIENTQRDVNIAFMNELAKIFNAMGIDTTDVIEAASTKWNFIQMKPGLVGGHCIGVDPYYLIEKAQVYGVLPRVMYAARRLNDGMGDYVANQVIKLMNLKGIVVKNARILILGYAFKENCPDVRNTKVADIYHTLAQYSDRVSVCDPWVDERAMAGMNISRLESLGDARYDAVVLAVGHREFASIDVRQLVSDPGVVYDVKGFFRREDVDGRL